MKDTVRGGAPAPNAKRIFTISVIALFTAAASFSLRAATAEAVKVDLLDTINPLKSGELIGSALGVAFLGFALTLFFASPLLNRIGSGRLLYGAAACFILGPLLIALAPSLATGMGVYNLVWAAMLIGGIGWGCTETAINPITAALYPNEKTHRLNVLHAWWPAGIIAGGLLGYALTELKIDWRIILFFPVIPALLMLYLAHGQSFPKDESAEMGVSTSDMLLEIFRRPSFFVWFALMLLTSSTELAPGQWVDLALTNIVGMRGILLLVFVSGIMFVMRHFAGPIAHRISSVGLLFVSSILALAGLWLMGHANSPTTAIVAAAVWGMGVCFMWPTMLAIAGERYPRGGSWTMGLMGSAGAIAIYFLLPKLGAIYDQAKIKAAGGEAALAGLQGEALNKVVVQASSESFLTIAIFPAILIGAFGVIWLVESMRGQKAVVQPVI
jgi:MFS family permease